MKPDWTKIYVISETAIKVEANGHMNCKNAHFLWELFKTFLGVNK